MKIWNGIARYPEGQPAVVATIGNYDGVHRGHQAILKRVVDTAQRRNLTSLLITFEPHPLAVVAPDRKPKLLQTRRQKLDTLEQTGLDEVLLIDFTPQIAALTGDEFFCQVLDGAVRFASIHVGDTFRFGHRRAGDQNLLRQIASERGFEVEGVPPVRLRGRTVSSSAIRAAVDSGDVLRAREMLGRPYAITGEVIRGEGRGRQMEFPTANIEVANELLPANGVYVSETVALASRFPSVTNIGVRPTFGGRVVTVESHLIEFEGDLYRERVEVRLLDRIRDEQRFAGPDELADQIARDRAAAESYFQNLLIGPS